MPEQLRAKPVARPSGRPAPPPAASTDVSGLDGLLAKWLGSSGAERANKDSFLRDLCDALGVPHPDTTTGDPDKDAYVFERDARLVREGAPATMGKVDLYKRGCFILEAKQGSEAGAAKLGTAKRGTPAWNVAMKDAYGQALGYARAFDPPVPFIVVADIGHCFDLYAAFDKSWDYRPFPNAQSNRLFLSDLSTHAPTLRQLFLDPHELDPSRHAAKVTREIAGYIANLAKKLESDGHSPDLVATFLMRCLFTMFAEDVGLLPERAFTDALERLWIPSPPSFPGGVESLWRAMNEGGPLFGLVGKLLKFNGGLFAAPSALPLDEHALRLLAMAAECNWADVEPAIFGTLIERALDPKERHALGAHYTPRAYVERLVRPTIEEPLREDWQLVQAQVRQLVIAADEIEPGQAPTVEEFARLDHTSAVQKGRSRSAKKGVQTAKINEALSLLHDFHRRLCTTRVLDPACGSGNFLYVTLDLFKRLEGEVLAALAALGHPQELLAGDAVRVTPAQFLGIEVKRWAKEIAELVLWIGYLQWHFRAYGKSMPVPEPVLMDYRNIACRDAILAWDGEPELLRDAKGKPVTRWDGETMKRSPVTGEGVPDDTARVPVYKYVNPRKADWPAADFIIGNPPFLGNARMRNELGDGYTEAVRSVYTDVPESTDFVMYWWDRAARLVRAGSVRQAGLITTTSLTQTLNRRVLEGHLEAEPPVSVAFAIADHPWTTAKYDQASGGAEVRTAMTVIAPGRWAGRCGKVEREYEAYDGEVRVDLSWQIGPINADLTVGANVAGAEPLRANLGLSCPGVKLHGAGFIVTRAEAVRLGLGRDRGLESHIRPYVNGQDLAAISRDAMVIDLLGLSEEAVRSRFPAVFQRVSDTVRPEREQNARDTYRRNWWLFGEPRRNFRPALAGLRRYIATIESARRRYFVFLDGNTLPDNMVIAVAVDDAYVLGVLSSRVHACWALAAGGRLGIRHDPRYNKTRCFEPFPFPDGDEAGRSRIRALAEQIDAHRKRQQGIYPKLTLTKLYKALDAARAGQELDAGDKRVWEEGLGTTLLSLHQDLDAAVFGAYGWVGDLTDEQILEKVVTLNAERVEEERRGSVRWLRPEFQNPDARKVMTQLAMAGADDDKEAEVAATAVAAPWPKKLSEQVAAVRDLLTRGSAEWSAADVVASLKGATEVAIVEVLDSLTALGLLVTYELPEGRRWRSAAFVTRRMPSVPPPRTAADVPV